MTDHRVTAAVIGLAAVMLGALGALSIAEVFRTEPWDPWGPWPTQTVADATADSVIVEAVRCLEHPVAVRAIGTLSRSGIDPAGLDGGGFSGETVFEPGCQNRTIADGTAFVNTVSDEWAAANAQCDDGCLWRIVGSATATGELDISQPGCLEATLDQLQNELIDECFVDRDGTTVQWRTEVFHLPN